MSTRERRALATIAMRRWIITTSLRRLRPTVAMTWAAEELAALAWEETLLLAGEMTP